MSIPEEIFESTNFKTALNKDIERQKQKKMEKIYRPMSEEEYTAMIDSLAGTAKFWKDVATLSESGSEPAALPPSPPPRRAPADEKPVYTVDTATETVEVVPIESAKPEQPQEKPVIKPGRKRKTETVTEIPAPEIPAPIFFPAQKTAAVHTVYTCTNCSPHQQRIGLPSGYNLWSYMLCNSCVHTNNKISSLFV